MPIVTRVIGRRITSQDEPKPPRCHYYITDSDPGLHHHQCPLDAIIVRSDGIALCQRHALEATR